MVHTDGTVAPSTAHMKNGRDYNTEGNVQRRLLVEAGCPGQRRCKRRIVKQDTLETRRFVEVSDYFRQCVNKSLYELGKNSEICLITTYTEYGTEQWRCCLDVTRALS